MHANKFQKLDSASVAVISELPNTIDQITIIRLPKLIKLIGLSRAAIYQRLQPSSPYYDDTFPKRVRLGRKSVGWRLSDVLEYVNNLEKVEA